MPAATASVNGHEADLTAHEGQEPKSQPAELDPARAANQAKFELELEVHPRPSQLPLSRSLLQRLTQTRPSALAPCANARLETLSKMLCALANPHYLLELASSGLLDPAAAAGEGEETEAPFVAFVRYLAYWEQADYAKYIMSVLVCLFPLPSFEFPRTLSCCLWADSRVAWLTLHPLPNNLPLPLSLARPCPSPATPRRFITGGSSSSRRSAARSAPKAPRSFRA